ncbi:hypothetical protein LV79_000149 [Actinokineospora globicatena]|nr:hypothetical protein [Actinokineospora globicatena]
MVEVTRAAQVGKPNIARSGDAEREQRSAPERYCLTEWCCVTPPPKAAPGALGISKTLSVNHWPVGSSTKPGSLDSAQPRHTESQGI